MRRMFGFLIGIFVGWLVGSTLALLLAPESGEKLRGELRARSTNFMGRPTTLLKLPSIRSTSRSPVSWMA